MPYFLRHHFEPDLTARQLKPSETGSGRVDHHNLGFVQNVVMEQVLAEFVEVTPDQAAAHDQRFIHDTPEFPAGRNTAPHPAIPTQLLAKANGHVAYEDDKIVVKKALRIGRDVDYHTGNIFFVGDILVEGSLRTGFEVQARNVLIKQVVEGARVVAESSIVCEAGVKGAKKARLFAGTNIRLPFSENATLLAREAFVADGSCMHCIVRAGKKLVVKERFQGGQAHCNGIMYVEKQLGGSTSTTTDIHLGVDPFLSMHRDEVDETIEVLQEKLAEYAALMEKSDEMAEEFSPAKKRTERKLEAHIARRKRLVEAMARTRNHAACRLVVPGTVRAGVTIHIGDITHTVGEHLYNVHFKLSGDDIVAESPAIKR